MELKVTQPVPVNPPKVYTLTFNEDEIKVLMNIHGNLPCSPYSGGHEHTPRVLEAARISTAIYEEIFRCVKGVEPYTVFTKPPEWEKK